MKILHTADWHLGNIFHGYDRTLEHRHFLEWLTQIIAERHPDALIVSGDVFDTANPPARAEQLYFDFLSRSTKIAPAMQTVIIAGNHDSAARLEASATLLRSYNIYVRGTIHFTEDGSPDIDHLILPLSAMGETEAKCVVLAVPYLRASDYPTGLTPQKGLECFFSKLHQYHKKSDFRSLPTIAVAHFYAVGADVCAEGRSERIVVGGQECIDASVVGRSVSYTALGHLHKAQYIGGAPNAYYAGSALPMSFSERSYKHGVNWIVLDEEGNASVSRINYQPLRNLISIPDNLSQAASRTQVLDAIENLPLRQKDDKGNNWPYLEIRLCEQQPEPTILHDVVDALSNRAVHFCRMLRANPTIASTSDINFSTPSTNTLTSMEPIELARRVFKARYDNAMPEGMVKRFEKAEKNAL